MAGRRRSGNVRDDPCEDAPGAANPHGLNHLIAPGHDALECCAGGAGRTPSAGLPFASESIRILAGRTPCPARGFPEIHWSDRITASSSPVIPPSPSFLPGW